METQIEKLTDLGAVAVQNAITEYTHWFMISSLCWLAFGAACAIGAVWLWKRREYFRTEDLDETIAIVCAAVLLGIAVLTVPCNVPTLLSPKAYAIHQLVSDARGK